VGNTIRAIRRGIKAGAKAVQESDPPKFESGGKTIICSHCGSDHLYMVGVAGISVAGYGIECSKCTHIQYFRKKPHQVG
jgi:hypothetical protein